MLIEYRFHTTAGEEITHPVQATRNPFLHIGSGTFRFIFFQLLAGYIINIPARQYMNDHMPDGDRPQAGYRDR